MKLPQIVLRTGLLFFFPLILATTGCDTRKEEACREKDSDTWINVSVRTASSSINEDRIFWEDRVDELRMLVFNPENGGVVFNEKLHFPEGFGAKSRAVRLPPGTYDFCFVANETTSASGFAQALQEVRKKSDFETDPRFSTIPYDPDFRPDGTSPGGRFLMSALYDGLSVATGGTEKNPLPLLLPTGKVELIRSLAKVEVIFRKRTPGSTIPANGITSVQLNGVAANTSVPPFDGYYTGAESSSNPAPLSGFDYTRDSMGTVLFYIPEFLVPENGTDYTELVINNRAFPVLSDELKTGISEQRRNVPPLSSNSVIRNYHYRINAYMKTGGEIQIEVHFEPWEKERYQYIFEGDREIVLPPVIPTDSSIIIPGDCGQVEILSRNENLERGLMGAYGDEIVNWYPGEIRPGTPPFHCEKKYGPGWRLINSCELLSFLAACDMAYRVWTSNTWNAQGSGLPYYSLPFRRAAQLFLEKLTGTDLSASVLQPENNWQDQLVNTDLGMLYKYFTPGDIVVREMDYPGGWPFPSPPETGPAEAWFYNEVAIQLQPYWASGYITLTDRNNWEKVLYNNFLRYDHSSTTSRCVRSVE